MNEDPGLDELFQSYRAACPDVEPGPNFMPTLWEKIETRHGFWFVFAHLARNCMAAAALLCVVLLALNFVSANNPNTAQSYTDALMADHSVEQTYYAEAIGSTAASRPAPVMFHHR